MEEAIELISTEISFIRGIPDVVDANAGLILQAEVSCTRDIKPAGRILLVNAEGDTLADMPLIPVEETDENIQPGQSAVSDIPQDNPMAKKPTKEELDRILGEREQEPVRYRSRTAEFTVKAPAKIGGYTWTARFIPGGINEGKSGASADNPGKIVHKESSTDISFKVRAHLISLSVWDVPFPVTRGEPFKVSIGACCSSACSLAGLNLRIMTGSETRTVVLGNEIVPNTKATFWTSAELEAPDDENVYKWTIDGDIPQSEHPHQIEPAVLNFRTAAPARYTVTINVVSRRDNDPLKGAYVMLGLYKGESNKEGISKLKVPAGKHKLVVTVRDYQYYEDEIDVSGDMVITTPLTFSPLI